MNKCSKTRRKIRRTTKMKTWMTTKKRTRRKTRRTTEMKTRRWEKSKAIVGG